MSWCFITLCELPRRTKSSVVILKHQMLPIMLLSGRILDAGTSNALQPYHFFIRHVHVILNNPFSFLPLSQRTLGIVHGKSYDAWCFAHISHDTLSHPSLCYNFHVASDMSSDCNIISNFSSTAITQFWMPHVARQEQFYALRFLWPRLTAISDNFHNWISSANDYSYWHVKRDEKKIHTNFYSVTFYTF